MNEISLRFNCKKGQNEQQKFNKVHEAHKKVIPKRIDIPLCNHGQGCHHLCRYQNVCTSFTEVVYFANPTPIT